MKIFLAAISCYYILVGMIYLFWPGQARTAQGKLLNKIRPIRSFSVFPLLVGIFLYYAAPYSLLDWMIRLLAVLAVIKGAVFLFSPKKTINAILFWWQNTSSGFMRVSGGLMVALGALIALSIR